MKTNIRAEFKDFKTNGKGVVSIGLVLKGDLSDTQILALHRLKAEGVVFADLFNGQADIEDYEHDNVTSEEAQQLTIYNVTDATYENTDGEPSDDEKEIESMESEVSQEEREKDVMPDDLPF